MKILVNALALASMSLSANNMTFALSEPGAAKEAAPKPAIATHQADGLYSTEHSLSPFHPTRG